MPKKNMFPLMQFFKILSQNSTRCPLSIVLFKSIPYDSLEKLLYIYDIKGH